MDGWCRMGSDDNFQIRQVLPVRAQFLLLGSVNRCIISIYIHPTLFCGSQEVGMAWGWTFESISHYLI